ncbi:hypothetical protein Bca52824_038991 [Brassica carinata]|uniref:Protein BZR1 homolog n=1 Tax=Brassica carinata TaxID=52824 RepID=A0A8X7UVF9_BRACI|nr:hypothetical protein Bca52824_038991 [Brassica carinata]
MYLPGGSISAPVTPPKQQTVPDSEWFAGIQLAQSVPASPTFSLVSRNTFGFREDQLASAGGGGGSRMCTPGQSGTCSPAPPPEFAFGSNANGLRVVLMISSSLLETQALGVIEKPVPTKPFFNMSLQFYFPM